MRGLLCCLILIGSTLASASAGVVVASGSCWLHGSVLRDDISFIIPIDPGCWRLIGWRRRETTPDVRGLVNAVPFPVFQFGHGPDEERSTVVEIYIVPNPVQTVFPELLKEPYTRGTARALNVRAYKYFVSIRITQKLPIFKAPPFTTKGVIPMIFGNLPFFEENRPNPILPRFTFRSHTRDIIARQHSKSNTPTVPASPSTTPVEHGPNQEVRRG